MEVEVGDEWAVRRRVGWGGLPGDAGVDARHEGKDTRGDDGADTHAREREPPELLLEADVTIHFEVVSDLFGQSGEPGGAFGQSESEGNEYHLYLDNYTS